MSISRRGFIGAAAAAAVAPVAPGLSAPAGFTPVQARDRPTRQQADRFDPWVEVDPVALAHNVARVTRLSRRPILAVLKNNAYGLGIAEVARLLEPMPEIEGFAVVRADEAHALRDAGVRKPVLLMARAATSDVPDLSRRDIELSIYADDDPDRLAPIARDRGPVAAQAYLDTGMARMGVRWDRATPFLRRVEESRAIRLTGIYTAFTEEPEFDREQLARFMVIVETARSDGIGLGRLHAASSNGVYHLPEAHLDMVRPGIALYGAYPSRPLEERAMGELVPAVRLRARVSRVSRLERGDSVSYGRNYVAEGPVWIATIPVGHADGVPRQAVEGGRILIGDRTYPVIGAVSASHTIVEVGDEPAVSVGDTATLLGPDHPDVHPNTLAEAVGVSVYDLLMHLGPLLPRFTV
jgi:alanine racemase